MAKLAPVSKITGTVFRSSEKMQKGLQRDCDLKNNSNPACGMQSLESTAALFLRRSSKQKLRLFASNSREGCTILMQNILETL